MRNQFGGHEMRADDRPAEDKPDKREDEI
jgi:hypothetical protein